MSWSSRIVQDHNCKRVQKNRSTLQESEGNPLTRNAVSVMTPLPETSATMDSTMVRVIQQPMTEADLTLGTSSGEEAA